MKKVNTIMAMDKENREKTSKSVAVKSLNAWHGEIPNFPTKRTEANNQLNELFLEMQSMNVNMTGGGQEQEGRNGRDARENQEFGNEDWCFGWCA